MIPDLAALRRKAYAKQHPDRDTRAMQCSDDTLALETAVQGVLAGFEKRLAWLERQQTARDAE